MTPHQKALIGTAIIVSTIMLAAAARADIPPRPSRLDQVTQNIIPCGTFDNLDTTGLCALFAEAVFDEPERQLLESAPSTRCEIWDIKSTRDIEAIPVCYAIFE